MIYKKPEPEVAPPFYLGVAVPESLQPNWATEAGLWWRMGVEMGQKDRERGVRYDEGLLAQKDVASAYAAIERTGYELQRPDGTGHTWLQYHAEQQHRKCLAREDNGTMNWFDKAEDLLAQVGAESKPQYLYQNLTVLCAWLLHWAVQLDLRRKRGIS